MRNCRICQNPVPLTAIVDGVVRNLQRRKLCLVCSPFGQHITCMNGPGGKRVRTYSGAPFVNCHICGDHRAGRGRRCFTCQTLLRKVRAKVRAIEYLGGSCVDCGYNKSIAPLQFHHLDPAQKEFNIGRYLGSSWATVLEELKKCVLLCANCHCVRHATKIERVLEEILRSGELCET